MLPRLLSPAAAVFAQATARRVARLGWRAPVPVLCCGNAGVGGAGKTTLALDLARRLALRGVAVHCLSRGYGGRALGVVRVDSGVHDASMVGDEPLLLAAVAPTWVCADRAAGARAAVAAGAGALLMDDGLQNPTLQKTLSLLTIDGGFGFGNDRRHFNRLSVGANRNECQVSTGRVKSFTRHRIFSIDSHAHFHRSSSGIIDTRIKIDHPTFVNGLNKVETID